MNLFKLTYSNIRSRPLNTLLNILILSFGISIIVILLLLTSQIEEKLTKNASNIDLVIGAKGSPLQLILSNIYHIDYPTGNIPLEDARKIVRNRYIKSFVPLALGDSYMGFRIVGTNFGYHELYNQKLNEGRLWKKEFEVTIGSNVAKRLNFKLNDEFHGGHGIVAGGFEHENSYKIVGIFGENDNVVDNLILTSIESVWNMHETHESHPEEEKQGHLHLKQANNIKYSNNVNTDLLKLEGLPEGEGKEITSLLVKYNSPMAIIQMPRMVNSINSLQAASPSIEIARLLTLFGVGIDLLEGFGYLVIFIASLSIFIALYNSLKERKYDLAIMRSLGASKIKLLLHVILEGVIITFIGGGFGFILGHGLLEIMARIYATSEEIGIRGLYFLKEEVLIALFCIFLGIVASLIPAISVYRTDVSKVLAEG